MYTFPIRVYYEDTDAGGIVYYANYLKFFERARTEWLRHLGYEQIELAQKTDCIFIVRDLTMRYHKPARLDDQILISAELIKLGKASMQFNQTATVNNELLAQGSIQIGCVNQKTLKPTAIPSSLYQHLTTLTIKDTEPS